MPTAKEAIVQFESRAMRQPMELAADSGDHKTFATSKPLWSKRSGYEAEVIPDGVINGFNITPAASGAVNAVDIAAGRAYINGAEVVTNPQLDVVAPRGSSEAHRTSSFVLNEAGVISVAPGTEGAAASTSRDSAGGPPLVAVGSIELGQVIYTSQADAAVGVNEIAQEVGTHQEHYSYPLWDENERLGHAVFHSALPLIHTGNAPKKVAVKYAVPEFTDVPIAADFVPPANSISIGSTEVYRSRVTIANTTLNAGSFTVHLTRGGIRDSINGADGSKVGRSWVKFYPNQYKADHIICNGYLGVGRSFPAADSITASVTINAEDAAEDIIG